MARRRIRVCLGLCMLIATTLMWHEGLSAEKGTAKNEPAHPTGTERLKIPAQVADLDPSRVTVRPLRDGLYLLVAGGANMVLQVGDEGVLAVNSLPKGFSAQVLAEIDKLADPSKTIHYVVNTSSEAHHIGNNAELAKAGSPVGQNRANPQPALIVAHENAANFMISPKGDQLVIADAGWPLTTYFNEEYDFSFNGTAIQLAHTPAITSGDSLVVFRRPDVVVAGDIFSTNRYPHFKPERGGSLQASIDAVNRLLEITVPKMLQEGGTIVIPSFGRIADEGDVVEYRDMLTIVRDRIRDLIAKGKTLQEVQAMRPTLAYDGLYGSGNPQWTPMMFVEAVYKELEKKK